MGKGKLRMVGRCTQSITLLVLLINGLNYFRRMEKDLRGRGVAHE